MVKINLDLPGLEDQSEEAALPAGDGIDNAEDTSSDDESKNLYYIDPPPF